MVGFLSDRSRASSMNICALRMRPLCHSNRCLTSCKTPSTGISASPRSSPPPPVDHRAHLIRENIGSRSTLFTKSGRNNTHYPHTCGGPHLEAGHVEACRKNEMALKSGQGAWVKKSGRIWKRAYGRAAGNGPRLAAATTGLLLHALARRHGRRLACARGASRRPGAERSHP